MSRELLFSITQKDLDIQYFRSGGPGGQHQNKTSSACRIVHKASGATGESREERSQAQNKKIAFKRLVENKKFQIWLRVEASARLEGHRDLEHKIEAMVKPPHIKIEVFKDGDWIEENDISNS